MSAADQRPGPPGRRGRPEGTLVDPVGPSLAQEVGVRPMRADAVRNRQRILQAAEEVFARDGIAVPVDVVAERAGVGIGTLYRHFPTKEALFEAIVVARIDALVAAPPASVGTGPTDAFFAFLARLAEEVTYKHDLVDAMQAAGFDIKSQCAERLDELRARVDHLRRTAVESGGVRPDVTTEQVMTLVIGASQGAGAAGSPSCQVMLQVVFDGLRTHP